MAPPAGVSWRRTCSPPHAPVTLASRSSGDVGAQALTSMNAAPVASGRARFRDTFPLL